MCKPDTPVLSTKGDAEPQPVHWFGLRAACCSVFVPVSLLYRLALLRPLLASDTPMHLPASLLLCCCAFVLPLLYRISHANRLSPISFSLLLYSLWFVGSIASPLLFVSLHSCSVLFCSVLFSLSLLCFMLWLLSSYFSMILNPPLLSIFHRHTMDILRLETNLEFSLRNQQCASQWFAWRNKQH